MLEMLGFCYLSLRNLIFFFGDFPKDVFWFLAKPFGALSGPIISVLYIAKNN
jgi:hypothetical protein